MNIKNLALYSAAIVAALSGINTANASFGVQHSTTTSDAVDTQATRLFNDAAFTDASEVGDPLWLVFDVDGDGIWATAGAPVAGNPIQFDPSGLGGANQGLADVLLDADDYVIFSTVKGPIQGRNNEAFTGLPSELQTGGVGGNDAGGIVKPTYSLLFDDANLLDGGTFGVNGAHAQSGAIGATGNVILRIGENTAADTFQFTAVPEPAAAAYVGLGLASLALLRRRMARA